jgi:hypothetical protein
MQLPFLLRRLWNCRQTTMRGPMLVVLMLLVLLLTCPPTSMAIMLKMLTNTKRHH